MLKPSIEFYNDKVEGRLTVLLSGVVAQEQRNFKEGGAVLFITNGRTKGGIGNNYVVRSTHWDCKDQDYKSRKFKAESLKEAIEHGNKILDKWRKAEGK